MRNTLSAAIIISTLLISIWVGMQEVDLTKADPTSNFYVNLTIENPQNLTYNVNTITVNFTSNSLSYVLGWSYYFSLDGGSRQYIWDTKKIKEEITPPYPSIQDSWLQGNITPRTYDQTVIGSFVLPNLAEGKHELAIYQTWFDNVSNPQKMSGTASAQFMIDTLSPYISNLSIENGRYNSTNIPTTLPLNFNVNEAASWIGYSLDNRANATVAGNTTLTWLTEGYHSVVVYANDTAGNMGKSDTIFFTINTQPSPPPTPTPTIPPTVIILSPANTSYAAIYDPYIHVPLIFETNKSLSWVGYSLDGRANITVSENGTIIEIGDASRSLTLYANDTDGNWQPPQTVYYEIAFNLGVLRHEAPFYIIWAGIALSTIVVGVILIVYYFKKRSQNVVD